jgi:hypothetical protein
MANGAGVTIAPAPTRAASSPAVSVVSAVSMTSVAQATTPSGRLLAGGVAPQAAAWAIDALLLYVSAYCLEASIVRQRAADAEAAWVVDRDELIRRFTALPAKTFPNTTRYAAELTAGRGHDRFDFTLALMIDGLATAGSSRPR